MRFLVQDWLWLLPVFALLGVTLWIYCGREFHRRLGLFAAAQLTSSVGEIGLRRKRLRLLLVILALAGLGLALARPLGGLSPQMAKRQGINLLIALDGSHSMLAEDVAPNRFAVAQQGIESLLAHLQGDRAGLLVFGGQATLVAPLTFDAISLQVINRSLNPELVGKGGSSLSEVIKRTVEYYRKKPYVSKVLVLVTDGEETEGDAVIAAQEAYQKNGLRIFTVGVGTADGGPIPRFERNLRREFVRAGTVRDLQGREVRTWSDEGLLRAVASVAGGTFVSLRETKGDLTAFYEHSLKPLAAPMNEVALSDYREWFQLPLVFALMLLVLEMAWPVSHKARASPVVLAAGKVVLALGLLACLGAPLASQAATADAQRFLAVRKFDQAFALLQEELLHAPDNYLTRYNYALGAYAVGKYSVAIESFEKLTNSAEPNVASRGRAQLGNCFYRLGEEMRPNNPEGTLVLWGKALAAYEKAPEIAATRHNFAKTCADLIGLLRELAASSERNGDTAARVSPDKGLPGWREAVAHLDNALKLVADQQETAEIVAARDAVSNKIFEAYFRAAEDKRRRAELQRSVALDRAIDLMNEAVGDYGEALASKPGEVRAMNAKREATDTLEPWLVELADQQHATGLKAREVSLEDAIALWQKAAGNYARVLQQNPANPAAQEGRKRNNRVLHDGYVELGDHKQSRADEDSLAANERDVLLEQALDHYQSALGLEPGDPVTKAKLMTLGRKMTAGFVRRGQEELAQGRVIATTKPPDAISWLERSVQSFGQALRFDPANDPAKVGRKEAEELLKKLRDLDARQQRKMLAQSKELNDPKDMEDPGKLALKLLDYNTDKLASKKQQNYTAPESRPAKDW